MNNELQWIGCYDQMPPALLKAPAGTKSKKLVLMDEKGNTYFGTFFRLEYEGFVTGSFWDDFDEEIENVAYWFELPELP